MGLLLTDAGIFAASNQVPGATVQPSAAGELQDIPTPPMSDYLLVILEASAISEPLSLLLRASDERRRRR